jgi:hypothetical protein
MGARLITLPVYKKIATYIGPGDIVGTNVAGAWLLRAFSAATAGTKCIRIHDETTTGELDINTLANGDLDTAAISSFLGGHAGTIAKFYDQSGHANDMVVSGSRVNYVPPGSPLASRPSGSTTGTQACVTASNLLLSQPFTVSSVAQCNISGAGNAYLWGPTLDTDYIGYRQSTTSYMYSGGGGEGGVSLPSTTYVAIQAVFNGASGSILVNGTTGPYGAGSSGSTGTVGWFQSPSISNWSSTGLYTAYSNELIIWSTNLSSGNQSSIESNQRTYYGI